MDRISFVKMLPFDVQVFLPLMQACGMTMPELRKKMGGIMKVMQMMGQKPEECGQVVLARLGGRNVFQEKAQAKAKMFSECTEQLIAADLAIVQACFGKVTVAQKEMIESYWKFIKQVGVRVHERGEAVFLRQMTKMIAEYDREVTERFDRDPEMQKFGAELSRPKYIIRNAQGYEKGLNERFQGLSKKTAPDALVEAYFHLQLQLYGPTLIKQHCMRALETMAEDHRFHKGHWAGFTMTCLNNEVNFCLESLARNVKFQEESRVDNLDSLVNDLEFLAERLETEGLTLDLTKRIKDSMKSFRHFEQRSIEHYESTQRNNNKWLQEARDKLKNRDAVLSERYGDTAEILRLKPVYTAYERVVLDVMIKAPRPKVDNLFHQMKLELQLRTEAFAKL